MISIDRLKVANLLFVERDYYQDLYDNCNELVSIKDVTIATQDSIKAELLSKIDNLNFIIEAKDNIIELERDKLLDITKKHKKERLLLMGGTGILIALLILL